MSSPPSLLRSGQFLDDQRNDDNECKEDRCNCAGKAEVAALEAFFVNVVHERAGRVLRAAFGHDVRLREQLHGLDDRDHEDVLGRIGQAGQRNIAELCPAAGAVDGSRLILFLRDALQAGEEYHHLVAGALPGGHEDDGVHRDVGVAQEVDRACAEGREQGVNKTRVGVRVVQDRPQDRDNDHRRNLGGKVHRAEDRHAAAAGSDEQCQAKGQHALDRHNEYGEVERVAQCHVELFGLEDFEVVFKADELHAVRTDNLVLEQRIENRVNDRDD